MTFIRCSISFTRTSSTSLLFVFVVSLIEKCFSIVANFMVISMGFLPRTALGVLCVGLPNKLIPELNVLL